VLRIAVESDSREAAECFARQLMPLITAGPQGTTGYAEGRPHVRPVFRYWPCLIPRAAVEPQVEVIESGAGALRSRIQNPKPEARMESDISNLRSEISSLPHSVPDAACVADTSPARLRDIAHARSGDKGTGANIGVIARSPEHYDTLCTQLTADRVAGFFSPLGVASVDRFELSNLHALNFILHGVLSRGLRTDAQGKTLAQALLEMPLDR
jgi:hypothetical protein